MCITFFCQQPQSKSKDNENIEFIMGFNRDQKIKRQTDPLGSFQQDVNIYAGRDKVSGGTWLGINISTGIMVILTNYDLEEHRIGKSRGKLVHSFLKTQQLSSLSLNEYNNHIFKKLSSILQQRQRYSAFNLIIYSILTQSMFYICSQLQMKQPRILQKNKSYGLCNCAIDVMWPKTSYGLQKFQKIIKNVDKYENNDKIINDIKNIMDDKHMFDKDQEKQSAIFIQPYYNATQQADRMTKSTTFFVIKKNEKDNTYILDMKEITYDYKTMHQNQVNILKVIKKIQN